MLVAFGAPGHAIVADIAFTSFARAPIILMHQSAAIAAVGTMPVFKPDVGATGVVGTEDLSNEQEEIEQSPLGECCADSCSALAFTELSGLDMGMRYIGVGRGRVRIEGRNLVGLVFVQAAQIEDDLEASEFDPFQSHLLRDNGDCGSLEIAFDFAELLLQRGEVTKDLAWRGQPDLGLAIREHARESFNRRSRLAQVLMERLAKASGGECPVVLLCLLDTACQSFALLPEAVGQGDLHGYAARLHEGFVDCSGGSGRLFGVVRHEGSPRGGRKRTWAAAWRDGISRNIAVKFHPGIMQLASQLRDAARRDAKFRGDFAGRVPGRQQLCNASVPRGEPSQPCWKVDAEPNLIENGSACVLDNGFDPLLFQSAGGPPTAPRSRGCEAAYAPSIFVGVKLIRSPSWRT